MTGHNGLFADARRRVRPSVLLPLLGGNALLAIAAMVGLEIPDSHAWQLLLSLLLGLGLVSGLLLWNATALRRLRSTAHSVRLWQGALLLGAWLLLGAALIHLVGLCSANVETRAGYWNSQLSASMRHLLTYTRLIALQQFAIEAVQWLLVPALLIPLAIETANFGFVRKAWKRGVRVLLSAQHWVVAILALGIAGFAVPVLVAWHPAHSVAGEAISALLRLSAAAALVVTATVVLLATDAELLHRSSSLGEDSSAANPN